MKMYEQTGEFTPDSLIASSGFPITTEGIGLKAGQGVLKRGSLIVAGADKAGVIAGTTGENLKVYGILTDDVDTGSKAEGANIPSTCYMTGIFNRDAVSVKTDASLATYEHEMRTVSLFLSDVQKY